MLSSCSTVPLAGDAARLRQTADLIEEVKAFGKTLGIEPTEALRQTVQDGASLSMLWLWMQREGTLALRGPVDIHLAIGLNVEKEAPKLEQVYRVDWLQRVLSPRQRVRRSAFGGNRWFRRRGVGAAR